MASDSEIAISDLLGVWKRVSIRSPDGREHTTTTVYWLQGRRYFADIRIPADRPSFDGIRSIADCTEVQRRYLATQEGFGGTLSHRGNAFEWSRHIDYRPGGPADIGRLRFVDSSRDRVIEEGVLQPYVEVWERIDRGGDDRSSIVLKLDASDRDERGLFVSVGDHFILAQHSRGQTEISYGRRSLQSEDWLIGLSTAPWREGQSFNRASVQGWQVLESTPAIRT